MPSNYYCTDNFFKKMTDLESPRKNNDCYFYYYSTCAKGDSCTFRHEPSALGCETMCSFWKEGKCVNVHCNFRHMELRKNRKAIPCYWESQPGGCLKPHCPFLHQNVKPTATNESHDSKTDSGTESADNTMNEKLSHMSEKSFAPVDSLVVNFEEESDNESAPTFSPIKTPHRVVKVKTLEEIKLEKIQAESAAYYSYPDTKQSTQEADDLRQRIMERVSTRRTIKRPIEPNTSNVFLKKFKKSADVNEIKIKTLQEIREERAKKAGFDDNAICDNAVSSTEDFMQRASKITKKIKLQRKFSNVEKNKVDVPVEASDEKSCVDDVHMRTNDGNKALDEVLLLQDDDDNDNVSLKEEERLLNELDDLLDD